MQTSRVAIVTDSTANLPTELLHQYHIIVLPLSLIWGEKTYLDAVEIQPIEFYQRLKTTKVMPSTSQVTPVQFTNVFSSLIDQGCEILCITIASSLSGTMDSAIQAKAGFPKARIELVDSQTTSLALGLQVLAAGRAIANGATLEECKAMVEGARANTGVFFVVDTLEFLYRGGRIGAAARFLGTALGLKPILELRAGQILPVERVRTQRKALDRLLELVADRIDGKSLIRLAVIDADASEAADTLMEKARQRFNPIEIFRGDVSPVIGTHAGPGTVGMAFSVEI